MARILRYLFIFLLLILCAHSVSGAISVQNIVITPYGDLISGQSPPNRVSISYTINFIAEGGVTFQDSYTLGMSTDLDNARWSYTTLLDGVATSPLTAVGRSVNVNGWVLSYPSRREVSMRVNLSGDVPAVTASTRKTLIKIGVYSGSTEINPGLGVTREANVILPGSPFESPGATTIQTTVQAEETFPDIPGPTPGDSGPAPSSLVISAGILMAILLAVSFIPLGLLVFHDHFGIGELEIPHPPRTRLMVAIIQILCGAGLLFVLSSLQDMYTALAALGRAPVFAVPVLVLVSYFALSAFALAIGSFLSRAFHWTIRVHVILSLVTFIVGPVALYLLGSTEGAPQAGIPVIVIAAVAALISGLLASWQDKALRPDLARDWFSVLAGLVSRGSRGRSGGSGSDTSSAISVLNIRLAKGEITVEEYDRLKEILKK
ncbi:MAG: SHOCT domain-containing protein [Methanoregulaceae archaeon]|nr:SHOCT domain-containing protein [Methanoregulaceae archaeon]